jgi:hypothetical protein
MGFGSEIRDPGVKKATLLVSELCISHLSISHTISLVHLSPVPCVNKYLYTVCVCGGGGGSGPQIDKHMPQSSITGQLF